jgi:hypothetical protein
MVDWDRRKRILEDWKWKVMDDVLQGKKPSDDRKKYTFLPEFWIIFEIRVISL